jgi:hypothetical protein
MKKKKKVANKAKKVYRVVLRPSIPIDGPIDLRKIRNEVNTALDATTIASILILKNNNNILSITREFDLDYLIKNYKK